VVGFPSGEKRVQASLGCALPVPVFHDWRMGEANYVSRMKQACECFPEGVLSMCLVQTGGCERQVWELGMDGYGVSTAL